MELRRFFDRALRASFATGLPRALTTALGAGLPRAPPRALGAGLAAAFPGLDLYLGSGRESGQAVMEERLLTALLSDLC